MKTIEQLQAAVDEIRDVCRKHDVALVGTCSGEGIYGEITIGQATQSALRWLDVADQVDNKIYKSYDGNFSVGGIGDVRAE